MRHRVLFAFPKPKAFMALGADGIDEGTEATQARVIQYPDTAESSGKDGD